jgi:transposase
VRPYSKGQKNDFRDAEAIAEAVQRPTTMKFVATKTAEQRDTLSILSPRKGSGLIENLTIIESCGAIHLNEHVCSFTSKFGRALRDRCRGELAYIRRLVYIHARCF